MTLKIRRIIYMLFILAFFIITPIVIFYAAGYKINLKGAKIQKTGTFILDTKPDGAKIYIDSKPQQTFLKKYFANEKSFIKTPAKIKNLLPGEYNLKMELDGYFAWEKKLKIKEGQSTYAENIYLFKKNLPALIEENEKNEILKQLIDDNLATSTFEKDKKIYEIEKSINLTNLKITDSTSKKLIKSIELPGSNYEFINRDHKFLNIFDKNHDILYLIDPFSSVYSPLRETINNIKLSYWVDDEKLLYANDFEIWIFDLKNNKKILLTRISEPIEKIIWHPGDNYVIYNAGNSIKIIELDEREKRNIIELIKLNKISSLYLNKKGDTLYFNAIINKQEGFYKLEIN
ncbi:MAG: PEGA domain-containing protein [Candidatus Falkowbacteria bacterium]